MKKFIFLLLLFSGILSCTTKKTVIISSRHVPKLQDYKSFSRIDSKYFYLDNDSSIFEWSEADKYDITLAEYSLGDSIFEKYCMSQITYPIEMIENGKYGRTGIIFGVREDGNIDSVKLIKGFYPIVDSLTLNIIKNQPPKMWIPAHREDGSFVYSKIVAVFVFLYKN